MNRRQPYKPIWIRLSLTMCLAAPSGVVFAQGSVTFTDITATSGISYARTPSTRNATVIQFRNNSLTTPVNFFDLGGTPMRDRGFPGVALLD